MSTPPTVIIAEPDPIFSSVLRVEFTRAGFSVLLASSGPEAEEYAGHTAAHLIVLDVKLRLQTFAACARIRRRPDYVGRPIILTTSELSPQIRAAARAACATLLILKPYSIDSIFKAVKAVLPPDDPLLKHQPSTPGVSAPTKEWIPAQNTTWSFGSDSVLTRNAQLLGIARGKGVAIPIVRRGLTT